MNTAIQTRPSPAAAASAIAARTAELHNDPVARIFQLKIMSTLLVFPQISRSMLQVGIGPGNIPAAWDPVLDFMITNNVVQTEVINMQGHSGRANTQTIYSLTESGKALAERLFKVTRQAASPENPQNNQPRSQIASSQGRPD